MTKTPGNKTRAKQTMSVEAKARNLGGRNAKVAGKNKAMQAVNADKTDNVTQLVQPPVAATKGKELATIPNPQVALAAEFAETDSKVATDQRYVANDEQRAFVAEVMAMDSDAITAMFKKLAKDTAEFQWKVGCLAVAIIGRIMLNQQTGIKDANAFVNALEPLSAKFSFIRTNSLKAWFEHYAPVVWGNDATNLGGKGFVFAKARHAQLAPIFGKARDKFNSERLERPFWVFKPQADFIKFSLAELLERAIKTASTYSELDDDERKNKFKRDDKGNIMLDLEGLDDAKKLLKKIKRAKANQDDKPTENSDAEMEAKAA